MTTGKKVAALQLLPELAGEIGRSLLAASVLCRARAQSRLQERKFRIISFQSSSGGSGDLAATVSPSCTSGLEGDLGQKACSFPDIAGYAQTRNARSVDVECTGLANDPKIVARIMR
jgi:hypothetical protein